MHQFIKAITAAALAITVAGVAVPAAAQVRVGVHVGAPVYAQPYAPRGYYAPAPAYVYGSPRVYQRGYYGSRYDVRARRDAEWRHREWLRREQWRREQWRREHWRDDRGWHGHR
jgi:hypothetical protein